MEIIPAIDIKGGRCVRLYQGDYERETVFSESPLEVASHWVQEGALRLHVVDLDGAKVGTSINIDLVADIASSVKVPVQLGGGIRTLEAARSALSLGVGRLVIGTAAVDGPLVVAEMCRQLGAETVAVSIDVRDSYVAVQGWTQSSRLSGPEMVRRVGAAGVQRFVYTDITKDGTLTEPSFRAIEAVAGQTELNMLVAGGISSVDHLLKLSRLGVEGAIVGRALYTGDIDLREAIEAVQHSEKSPA